MIWFVAIPFLDCVGLVFSRIKKGVSWMSAGRDHIHHKLMRKYTPEGTLFIILIISSSGMYLVEKDIQPEKFGSIPQSMWWSIVTLTTVGYGDIAPQTVLGQFFASIIMILGYAIIDVPTGMISVELARAEKMNTQSCPSCGKEGHDNNATFCKF